MEANWFFPYLALNSQHVDPEGKPVNRGEKEKHDDLQRQMRGEAIPCATSSIADACEPRGEEFFCTIVENGEDFFAVLDLEGRRLYNSPSYANLFGDIERLKGSDSFAEIHPADVELVKRAFKVRVYQHRPPAATPPAPHHPATLQLDRYQTAGKLPPPSRIA